MDYGDRVRANILTNHGHAYGIEKQESYIKWEGAKGAIKSRVGTYLGYPQGVPDLFEYVILEDGKEPAWKTYPIDGTWFPDAFIGPMACLMRYAQGETDELCISTDDALYTMAVVEAAYESSEQGGTPIPVIG
jgi:predicted dehydrogenase